MKAFKKVLSIIMIAAVIASICVITIVPSGAACTGAGLAEWALRAYNEGWSYSWGGSSVGAVDCSGLIWSYCGGNRTSMLSDAQSNGRDWGYVSSGIPRVHGLGLARTGHVGVYIADGMEVDARGDAYGVCYQAIGSYNSWDCWFKLTAVSYPTTGWEKFNGDSYYYENGEYIVSTTRTIDGVTYSFNSKGVASKTSGGSSDSSSSSSSNSSSSASAASTDDGYLKNGSTGSAVKKLQQRLLDLGYYNGAVDGDFGDLTEAAFKLFQKTAGLYEDGIAGSDADVLYSDSAPAYVAEEEDDEEEIIPVKNTEEDIADTGVEEDIAEEAAAEDTAEPENTEITYSLGDYADEIVLIQERLNTLGYLDAAPDGEFGTQTEAAVIDFQDVNELAETGIVDEVTYNTLFSDDAKEMPVVDEKKADPAADKDAQQKTKVNAPAAKPASPAASSAAPNTDVEQQTTAVTSKTLAGVTNNVDMQKAAKSTNFEFILWLAIMIVVMLITFTIVYTVEKKKARAAARARRFY